MNIEPACVKAEVAPLVYELAGSATKIKNPAVAVKIMISQCEHAPVKVDRTGLLDERHCHLRITGTVAGSRAYTMTRRVFNVSHSVTQCALSAERNVGATDAGIAKFPNDKDSRCNWQMRNQSFEQLLEGRRECGKDRQAI